MEHTPYHIVIMDDEYPPSVNICDVDGEWICECGHPEHEGVMELAAFIVKACNNYEALVEALRDLVRQVAPEPQGRASGLSVQNKRLQWFSELGDIRRRAEAALEAAGEL